MSNDKLYAFKLVSGDLICGYITEEPHDGVVVQQPLKIMTLTMGVDNTVPLLEPFMYFTESDFITLADVDIITMSALDSDMKDIHAYFYKQSKISDKGFIRSFKEFLQEDEKIDNHKKSKLH